MPTDALVEDGRESIVFVQPDPGQSRFVRRRVAVTRRFHDVVYLRDQGDQGVRPGMRVVTGGALFLRDALADLPLPAGKG